MATAIFLNGERYDGVMNGGGGNSSSGLPDGGTAGQVLTKNSSESGDAVWSDPLVTKAVNDLENYYLKSDIYNKAEINSLISGLATGGGLELVQTLPSSDISNKKIYLVPKVSGVNGNVYDEYVYVSGAWELIGSTEIALAFDVDANGNASLKESNAGVTVGSRANNSFIGSMSVSIGQSNAVTNAAATAFGMSNTASGVASHAEGTLTSATAQASHAEGTNTVASAANSHAEGAATRSSGQNAHSEGRATTAAGEASHAGGVGTLAAYPYQTVVGSYNDNKADTIFEVGNGQAEGNSDPERSNALEVYANGNLNVTGVISQNGTAIINNRGQLNANNDSMSGHPAIWYNGHLDYSGMNTLELEAMYNNLKNVDPSEYYTKTEVQTLIDNAIGAALSASY